MRELGQWTRCWAIIASLTLSLLSCERARSVFIQPNQEQAATNPMVQGSNKASKNRWTSDNRPTPWTPSGRDDWGEPFLRSDRFAIQPYQALEREKHREEMSKKVEVLGTSPQAACEGLPRQTIAGCPLLDVHWSAREERPEGVLLQANGSTLLPEALQRQLQCHLALGKLGSGVGHCPLQWQGITARAERRGGDLVLLLESRDRAQAAELRRIVRVLVKLP